MGAVDKCRIAYLYQLKFPNGKLYFGLTTYNVSRRFSNGHVRSAMKLQSNLPVHCAIRKYGAASVELSTIVIGTIDYVKYTEIALIDAFKTTDRMFGYNVTKGGDFHSVPGWKQTPEAKEKIAASKRGKKKSKEEIERRTATRRANGGFKLSVNRIKAMHEARKNKAEERGYWSPQETYSSGWETRRATGYTAKRGRNGRYCSI